MMFIRKLILGISLCMAGAGFAQADNITVAALGDSLTQGYGLPAEDGFVPQLQAWLTEQGQDVTLINAGVSGDTTAGGLSRVGWTLTEDVDAMIVALGGNDLLRGIAPETARANLDGILQAAQAQGVQVLLVGVEAPGNYGPEYKQAFDAIYPELAQEYSALLFPAFLEPLLAASPDRASALRDYVQADGLHPNAQGVEVIVAAIGPVVIDLIDRAD